MQKSAIKQVAIIIMFFGVLVIGGCTTKTESVSAAWLGETKTTGTTETGDVVVALTPKRFAGGILAVDVNVNTHSVDLSPFDLAKITTFAANGKTYRSLGSSQLSGHHASGVVLFKTKNIPQRFTIRIQDIPAQQQRIYQWGE